MKDWIITILLIAAILAVIIAVNVCWFDLVSGAEIPLWLKWVLLRR